MNVNLAKALRDEGDRLDDKIPPAEVADIYRLGMSIAEQVGDKKEVLSALNDIGLALAQTDQDQALATYQKALKLADDTGNKDMSARIYGNIGVLYFEQKSDIARTLENAQKSVAIAEEIGNKQIQANSLALIGNTYNLQGNYQKALEYQQKALAVREEIKDKRAELHFP